MGHFVKKIVLGVVTPLVMAASCSDDQTSKMQDQSLDVSGFRKLSGEEIKKAIVGNVIDEGAIPCDGGALVFRPDGSASRASGWTPARGKYAVMDGEVRIHGQFANTTSPAAWDEVIHFFRFDGITYYSRLGWPDPKREVLLPLSVTPADDRNTRPGCSG